VGRSAGVDAVISTLVFEAVRAGRMTPEVGAEWLMAARDPGRVAPTVWALAIVVGALLGLC